MICNDNTSRPSKQIALILCTVMLNTCCMSVVCWQAKLLAFSKVGCSTLKPDHQQMGVCLAKEYCSFEQQLINLHVLASKFKKRAARPTEVLRHAPLFVTDSKQSTCIQFMGQAP